MKDKESFQKDALKTLKVTASVAPSVSDATDTSTDVFQTRNSSVSFLICMILFPMQKLFPYFRNSGTNSTSIYGYLSSSRVIHSKLKRKKLLEMGKHGTTSIPPLPRYSFQDYRGWTQRATDHIRRYAPALELCLHNRFYPKNKLYWRAHRLLMNCLSEEIKSGIACDELSVAGLWAFMTHKAKHKAFQGRIIESGMMYFQEFAASDLRSMIEFQGWGKFLDGYYPHYGNLIRWFYFRASSGESFDEVQQQLTITDRENCLIFGPQRYQKEFSLTADGCQISFDRFPSFLPYNNRNEACMNLNRSWFNADYPTIDRNVRSDNLSDSNREILSLIRCHLLPPLAHTTFLSAAGIQLILCLRHRIKINLPFLICKHIEYALDRSSPSVLPYGGLISYIMRKFWKFLAWGPRMIFSPPPPGFGVYSVRACDRIPGEIRVGSNEAKEDHLSQLLTYSSGSSPESGCESADMDADDECSSSG